MTFLLLIEDLRCFNYLSNSVQQRTGIEISSIRPDIRPKIRYLVLRMAGYPAKLLSGPSLKFSNPFTPTAHSFSYSLVYSLFPSFFYSIEDTYFVVIDFSTYKQGLHVKNPLQKTR